MASSAEKAEAARRRGRLIGPGSPAARSVPGSGRPILALHGFGGTPREVDGVLDVASELGRPGLAPLLPGQRRSGWSWLLHPHSRVDKGGGEVGEDRADREDHGAVGQGGRRRVHVLEGDRVDAPRAHAVPGEDLLREEASGEAWEGGPVVLSWQDAAMTDAEATKMVKLFGGDRTMFGTLDMGVIHSNETYGTLAVYLRAKSKVPPTSQR